MFDFLTALKTARDLVLLPFRFPPAAAVIAAFGLAGAPGSAENFASASASSATNGRLIGIAVGILQRKPSQTTGSLRAWAIQVIDRYSDVPLDSLATRLLRDSVALPFIRMVPGSRTELSPWQGEGVSPAIDMTCTREGVCDTTYFSAGPDTGRARKKRR